MEATCKTCNHWEDNAPVVENRDGFGECNVLSQETMQYVLPVIKNPNAGMPGAEIITNADFGCNQYANA